jgi:uncharacterized protein (DUF2141 family)
MTNSARHNLTPSFGLAPALVAGFAASAFAVVALAVPAAAQPGGKVTYRNIIAHEAARCAPGAGSSVLVTVNGIKATAGTLRVQSYRGTKEEWLEKGMWINRIELPAREGSMTVCMPVPGPGTYGIAVRHDLNGNGKTDLSTDGGAMSNNPSLNIFNLGKPSYKKTQFTVGQSRKPISINMRYR